MSEEKKQVLENVGKMLPNMSEVAMARLIGYGEGLAAREDRQSEANDIQTVLAGRSDAE